MRLKWAMLPIVPVFFLCLRILAVVLVIRSASSEVPSESESPSDLRDAEYIDQGESVSRTKVILELGR